MIRWLRHPSAALAAAFTLLAVVVVTALTVARNERDDQRRVEQTLAVDARLAGLLARLQDAESRQRTYLVTGDQTHLAALGGLRAAIQTDLNSLAVAIRGSPRQEASMARLRPLVRQRLASLDEGIGLRRAQGFGAASAYVRQGRGLALMDGARRELALMQAEAGRQLQLRQRQAAVTRRSLRAVVGLGMLCLLGVTTYAVIYATRQLRLVAVSRDELLAANARLQAEAEARGRAEAQVRQMQKMEAIGHLTGGIAHDFNNMLSVVIGNLELIRRRMSTAPERVESYIDNALQGAQRAAGLTARLLAFSRQQPLAPTPLDPNRLVLGMAELLHRTLGEQLSLEHVLAAGVWRVNVDPQQLENALLNLCVNARDAMPEGGKLTIETSNAFLDEAYVGAHVDLSVGQYVLMAISDTGVGMTQEVVGRAFDPFFTTKDVGQGTGLGLSQVFGFVKQSGGHIKIYSEPGQGTCVKIYLPRWGGVGAPEATRSEPQRPPRALGEEVVLVVEDDDQVRQVTVESLRELGYTVFQASAGAEALQRLRASGRVDLLLTDIVMPGMTGRALATAALEQRPELRILYMTGYSRNAVVHNGVLDAGVAFLQKPFSGEQLAWKVRQVLEGRGANRVEPN